MEYRICEYCNHPNDTSFLECEKCEADLSFVHPTAIEKSKTKESVTTHTESNPERTDTRQKQSLKTMRLVQIKLVSMKDGFVINVPFEGGTIGREGTIASHYFSDNLYISNQHAEIMLKDNGYAIIDHQSTNGTKINGRKLEKNIEYPLQQGDQITFANMNFKIEE